MLKFKNFSNIIKRTLMVSVLGLSAFTMASCGDADDQDKGLDLDANYLTVSKYSVNNGDVWNELKWDASSLFASKKEEVILKSYLDDIKNKDHEDQAKYKERLQNYLIEDVHNFDFSLDGHEDELKELDEKTKTNNYKKYADEVYKNHKVELTTNQIIDNLANNNLDALEPLYKLYYLDLAKELYAKDKLNEEIVEKNESDLEDDNEDTIGYFSKSDIISQYRKEYLNQGDVDVIMIKFASEAEANNTLRSFGIKVKDNQFYYLTDTPENFNDYKTYYDDFSFGTAKDSEYLPLDSYYGNSMILQLYISMYNYIYTYREPLVNDGTPQSTTIDNRSITAGLIAKYDNELNITDKASDEARVDALMQAIKNTENAKFVHYTSDQITEMDSALHSYIYKDLTYKDLDSNSEWVEKESMAKRYSTSSKSIDDGYYMVFKESQKLEAEDKLNYDEFWNPVKDDDLYNELTKEANKATYDAIISDLTDDKLTKTYIDEKINKVTPDVTVRIFDKNVEITYAVKNADYSKTLAKAPNSNTIASFEYDGNTVNLEITNAEGTGAWDILEFRNGVFVASRLISQQKIKETETYKNIEKDEIDNYYRSIEYILASFANDALAQQGYPSSIGKYNFLMLYYHTADIDEIVDNVFKIGKASSELLVNYADESILNNVFEAYTTKAYENFFSVTTKNLSVFIDTDEDGKPDDIENWKTLVAPTSSVFAGQTYEEIAIKLIQEIYAQLLTSKDATAQTLDNIVTKFNQSSRFNPKEGDRFDKEDSEGNQNYDPIGSEWTFSQYKKLGFAITANEVKVSNTTSDVDLKIRKHIKSVYEDNNFKDKKYLSSFLEDANDLSSIVEVNDSFNYFAITSIERPTSAKYEAYKDPKHVFENIHIMYNDKLETIENAYNDDDMLNKNQIRTYILEKLAYETSNLLPSEISQSLTNYCDPVLTRFLDTTTQSEIVYKYVSQGSSYEFANAENNTRFNNLRTINQAIADDYIENTEESQPFNNFYGWWETIKNLELKGGNN